MLLPNTREKLQRTITERFPKHKDALLVEATQRGRASASQDGLLLLGRGLIAFASDDALTGPALTAWRKDQVQSVQLEDGLSVSSLLLVASGETLKFEQIAKSDADKVRHALAQGGFAKAQHDTDSPAPAHGQRRAQEPNPPSQKALEEWRAFEAEQRKVLKEADQAAEVIRLEEENPRKSAMPILLLFPLVLSIVAAIMYFLLAKGESKPTKAPATQSDVHTPPPAELPMDTAPPMAATRPAEAPPAAASPRPQEPRSRPRSGWVDPFDDPMAQMAPPPDRPRTPPPARQHDARPARRSRFNNPFDQ